MLIPRKPKRKRKTVLRSFVPSNNKPVRKDKSNKTKEEQTYNGGDSYPFFLTFLDD